MVITWQRGVLAVVGTAATLVAAGWLYWLGFDLDRLPTANPAAMPSDIAFLATPAPPRGRILAVVTSAARLGDSGRRGGYELTELARAYYVFVANGYEVDIASPQGGKPTAVIDDDLLDVDHAFLNDPNAQQKTSNTLRLSDVDPQVYAGIYFVGGKGAMADFPGDPDIERIVADIDARGGVIGAVCHGPAALTGLLAADGRPLLAGRRVTGFSNAEELFLIKEAHRVFGTLLQDRLHATGAIFVEAPMYLDNTVVDGRLVTGQNPWSTWSVAEGMIRALGHQPVARAPSGEERAIQVLAAYRSNGFDAARAIRVDQHDADTRLLLLHALIAAMQGEVHDAFQLQRLARP
jgi:putative intracellular protease/amidase